MLCLFTRVGDLKCALKVEHVLETMRPLPLQYLRDMPVFALGASVIRGQIVPVVDLSLILTGAPGRVHRYVAIRSGPRQVALAVEEVIGIREVEEALLSTVPPLLHQEAQSTVIDSIARLDRELLLVLQGANIFPEEAWAALQNQSEIDADGKQKRD